MLKDGGFFVVVLCTLFSINGELQFCVSDDNRKLDVGSVWINKKGCNCSCTTANNYSFTICQDCSSIDTRPPANRTNVCNINGFTYTGNEKWLSTEKECSMCRCVYNRIECESAKHCSNPCQEGQIVEYGPCCQAERCSGNATVIQANVNCVIDGEPLNHGKSVIKRSNCTDKYCNCNNGFVQCYEYCDLLTNNSFQFWDKFCCPKPIVTVNVTKPSNDGFNTAKDIAFSKPSTESLNTTKHIGLTDTTMKELFIILCLFCFVILVLLAIVFIIRTLHKNKHKKYSRHNRLSLILEEDVQAFDVDHNYGDRNHR